MPAAPKTPPTAPVQAVAERLIRSLIYYAALFTCVVIAIGVSYSVILRLARDAVSVQAADPEAVSEARSLQDYAKELREIATTLTLASRDGEPPVSDAFTRRLNDLRRRMLRFPKDSDALNQLIQTGDRMTTWAASPKDDAARRRALDTLAGAESAVTQRLQTLGVP